MRKLTLKLACLTLVCALPLLGSFACNPPPDNTAKTADGPAGHGAVGPGDTLPPPASKKKTARRRTTTSAVTVTGIPISAAADPEVANGATFNVTVTLSEDLKTTDASGATLTTLDNGVLVDDGVLLLFHDSETKVLMDPVFVDNTGWLAVKAGEKPVMKPMKNITNNTDKGNVVVKAMRCWRLLAGPNHPLLDPNGNPIYILTDKRHVAATNFKSK